MQCLFTYRLFFYFLIFLMGLPVTCVAAPVEIVLSGTLSAISTDSNDLGGAQLWVSYQADSTDTPVSGYRFGDYSKNEFRFTVSLSITNRPESNTDLFGEWTDLSVMFRNSYSTSDDNDGGEFWITGGGSLPIVHAWEIDFGTNSIIPDEEVGPRAPRLPGDLSFLLSLGKDFTSYVVLPPFLHVSSERYSISNLSVTNMYGISAVPAPASIYLFGTGLLLLLLRMRRHSECDYKM